MAERLLGASLVHLFGRVLQDMSIDHTKTGGGKGKNKFAEGQFDANTKLARIYSFSFEGRIRNMYRPAIFVVDGEGSNVHTFKLSTPPPPEITIEEDEWDRRSARSPGAIDIVGAGTLDGFLAEDLMYWTYDHNDISVRLDAQTDTIFNLLVVPEADGAAHARQASGMWARSSGMWARSSGMWARGEGTE